MTVINREREALTSSMTAKQFGQAMAQLDLSSIPPAKRKAALMDHLMRIQVSTIHDRAKAAEIELSRKLHHAARSAASPSPSRPRIILP